MSDSFLAARGCVYVVPASGQGNTGLYRIEGFPQASADAPVLLQGVEITDSDITMPVATLDNFKVLYSFGQDFGNVVVFGEVLLGPNGKMAEGLTKVLKWFKENRVSASKRPVNVSLPGGTSYKIYINGLSIGRADGEFNIQPFALSSILAEPPK